MVAVAEVTDPVVLVGPTINDGTVVRWYRDVLAVRNGRAMASASRLGVQVSFAPRGVVMAALDAHDLLAAGRAADVAHLATHVRGGFIGAELIPVAAAPPAGGGSYA